jgi:hypothetical protein
MLRDASELRRRLAREAESVCRHYLASGRREGRYWLVGDVRNAPGRSMFVRLEGPESGRGAAGEWTDAATGEHGDLLDVIRESCGLIDFHDVAGEARRICAIAAIRLCTKEAACASTRAATIGQITIRRPRPGRQ